MVNGVAGRTGPWNGNPAPCARSPTQNSACRFPAPGSPGRARSKASSHRRMERLRIWQLEPWAALEVRPEQPVTLAASTQCSHPLSLNLAPDPIELRLAVVQRKVLVEAAKHPRQLTLLVPALPVSMALEPLRGACQKPPAALLTRDADQSK